MLLVREGDQFVVVGLIEAKAGRASKSELTRRGVEPHEVEQLEVERKAEAIEELKKERSDIRGTHTEIYAKYEKEVDEIKNGLERQEAGQIRQDIERLHPTADDTDAGRTGAPIRVAADDADDVSGTILVRSGPQTTSVIATLPRDISRGRTVRILREEGLPNVIVISTPVTSDKLPDFVEVM
jgi:hypothetical protein